MLNIRDLIDETIAVFIVLLLAVLAAFAFVLVCLTIAAPYAIIGYAAYSIALLFV